MGVNETGSRGGNERALAELSSEKDKTLNHLGQRSLALVLTLLHSFFSCRNPAFTSPQPLTFTAPRPFSRLTMRSAVAAVALSALASTALGASLSLPINLNLDLETSLLSLKLDPTVDPSVNLYVQLAACSATAARLGVPC